MSSSAKSRESRTQRLQGFGKQVDTKEPVNRKAEKYNIKWSDHSFCEECQTAFTVFNRQHHCRSCGCTLCDGCSRYKDLQYDGKTKEKRVCLKCHSLPSSLLSAFNEALQIVHRGLAKAIASERAICKAMDSVDQIFCSSPNCPPSCEPFDILATRLVTSGTALRVLERAELHQDSEAVLIKTCRFISHVAQTKANSTALVGMGTVRLLSAAMLAHQQSVSVQESACYTLWRIARCADHSTLRALANGSVEAVLLILPTSAGDGSTATPVGTVLHAVACSALLSMAGSSTGDMTLLAMAALQFAGGRMDGMKGVQARTTGCGVSCDRTAAFSRLHAVSKQRRLADEKNRMYNIPVGVLDPRWEADTAAIACPAPVCGGSRFKRGYIDIMGYSKHHCRVCGRIFCDACTDLITVPWEQVS